jgi:hypothetical protein
MRLSSLVGEVSDRKGILLSFILGFIIRLVPEILSYPYPVGFDTVYYAARIKSGVVWNSSTSVFSMWLYEGILISIDRIVQMDPFLLLKLVAPLLFGLNACGIYFFSRKALNWRIKTALIAASFFAFQLASLRLSWDLHRNLLGSAILLFALPLTSGIQKNRNYWILLGLSMLLVLSHALVFVMFLAAVLAMFFSDWLRRHRFLRSLKLLAVVSPSLVVLLLGFLVFRPAGYFPENVLESGDIVHQSPAGFSFLVSYVSVSDSVQNYPSYLILVLHVFSLFSILYLWWLPLVFVGFFRNGTLDACTLLLLFGSFDALITPFFALDFWNRWMFMLVYPFTFYATRGVEKLLLSGGQSVVSDFSYLNRIKITKRRVIAVFSVAVVFGVAFLTVPPFSDRFGVFSIPTTSPYLPPTALYNSIPLRDVRPTIEVFEWLNENMNANSSVLMHHAFLWWADLYLDKNHTAVHFVRDVEKALAVTSMQGYDRIYMIWWNEPLLKWQNLSIGWYGLDVPNHFMSVFSSDRISVYEYQASIARAP